MVIHLRLGDMYCMLQLRIGCHYMFGNILYCVLQGDFGDHIGCGSTMVMVIRGVSPLHALTHDSSNLS